MKAFIRQNLLQLKWRTCYGMRDTCLFTPTEGGRGSECSHVHAAHLPASVWVKGKSATGTAGGRILQVTMHTPSVQYVSNSQCRFWPQSVYKRGKRKNQSTVTWIYITFDNSQLPDAGKKSLSSHAPDLCCNFCRGSEEIPLTTDSLKTRISEMFPWNSSQNVSMKFQQKSVENLILMLTFLCSIHETQHCWST